MRVQVQSRWGSPVASHGDRDGGPSPARGLWLHHMGTGMRVQPSNCGSQGWEHGSRPPRSPPECPPPPPCSPRESHGGPSPSRFGIPMAVPWAGCCGVPACWQPLVVQSPAQAGWGAGGHPPLGTRSRWPWGRCWIRHRDTAHDTGPIVQPKQQGNHKGRDKLWDKPGSTGHAASPAAPRPRSGEGTGLCCAPGQGSHPAW